MGRRGRWLAVVVGLVFMVQTPSSFSVVPPETNPPIPPNNRNLDRIIAHAAAASELAAQCQRFECPDLDCEKGQEFFIALRDARLYTRLLFGWLKKAAKDHRAHFEALAEEGIITTENLARAQEALAWQEFLHNFGSAMLDIASVSSALKETLEDPSKLRSTSFKDVMDNLDRAYEAVKDYESGVTTLASGVSGGEKFSTPVGDLTPDVLGISHGDINNHKSTLSDLKTIIEAAREHGKDWRKALTKGGAAAALGQIAGRYLKAYSEGKIAERQGHIRSLMNNLMSTDLVQSEAFTEWGKVAVRRNKAEDAFLALDKLIVASDPNQGGYTRCLLKDPLRHCVPSLDLNYVSRVQIPGYANLDSSAADSEDTRGWGRALPYLNQQLPQLVERLSRIPAVNPASDPSLRLSKRRLAPGETFQVEFRASRCYAYDAWVGIVPSDISHGQEAVNDSVAVSHQYLRRRKEGTLTYQAPDVPRCYDVRMHDTDRNGREVHSVTFAVQPALEAQAGRLAGTWADQAGNEILIAQDGNQITLQTTTGLTFRGNLSGNQLQLSYTYRSLEETPARYPPEIRRLFVGDQILLEGIVAEDGESIQATFVLPRYDTETKERIEPQRASVTFRSRLCGP